MARIHGAALFAVMSFFGSSVACVYADNVTMTRLSTLEGEKYFGPLVEENADEVLVFNLETANTASIPSADIRSRGEVDESLSHNYVPFSCYAAWKLGQIIKSGRLEATIVHNSSKGIYINCGTSEGLVAGQRCALLSEAETVVDPETDKVLGVIRDRLGVALPIKPISENLSRIVIPESVADEANPKDFEVARQVEVERKPKRIVLSEPTLDSREPDETLDEAGRFLHSHLTAELVRFGFVVVSKKQLESASQKLAEKRGVAVEMLPEIDVAKSVDADVMLSPELIGKGVVCEVQVQVTDLEDDEYLGIILGKVKRKEQEEEAQQASKFAKRLPLFRKFRGVGRRRVIDLLMAGTAGFNDAGDLIRIDFKNVPLNSIRLHALSQFQSLERVEFHSLDLTAQALRQMKTVPSVGWLSLSGARVDDEAMQELARVFPNLWYFGAFFVEGVSAEGWKNMVPLPKLRNVYFDFSSVDNQAALHFGTESKIKVLSLKGCKMVDDGCIDELCKQTHLKRIQVHRSGVSDAGVAKLRAALPNCHIVSD